MSQKIKCKTQCSSQSPQLLSHLFLLLCLLLQSCALKAIYHSSLIAYGSHQELPDQGSFSFRESTDSITTSSLPVSVAHCVPWLAL